jgi:hypothetical protein
MTDDQTEGEHSPPSQAGPDDAIGDMEEKIDRIDERIDEAKEKADDAAGYDPRSLTADQDGDQSSTGR